jgi:preprotein translocase subunit SecF
VRLLRIVPDETKFDFIRFRRISFPVSAMMSMLAIFLFFFHGLNFGIDFRGGTLIEVQAKSGQADIAQMRATLGELQLGDFQLQQFGGPAEVLIRIAEQPGGEGAQQAAVAKVRTALGDQIDFRRVEVVGPRVSGELLSYGTIGMFVAIVAILIYLWFRFEWQFALGAMIANVHDIVLTIGFMSVTQIDFDLTSIAALLTILGYSLNDTVVIYDRIREMLRRYKKMPMPELLNISINSTLSRSVITHVTVAAALLSLLLFGGQAIHSFTATMMFGVVLVGTYTSVFIASPILIYLGVGTARRGESSEAPEPAAAPKNPATTKSVRSKSEPATSEAPKSEAPKSEGARSETPQSETPKSETPKSETPKSEALQSEAPASEALQSEAPNLDKPKPGKLKSGKPKSGSKSKAKSKTR